MTAAKPEGKWTLELVLLLPQDRLAVSIRATRRTKQELSSAWREAKQMVQAGDAAAARAYNADTLVVLGYVTWPDGKATRS